MKKRLLSIMLAAGVMFTSLIPPTGAAELKPEEMKAKIETLESEKAELEEKVEALEAENEALKAGAQEKEAETETETEEEKTDTVGTVYTDKAVVKVVQEALNAAGYNCGTPDGIAGSKTGEAISAYEKEKKLNVNGVITDELLDSLEIADEIKEAAEKEAKKANYKSDYSYEQLARNPDSYEGDLVKFTGKVLQAESGSSINYLRLAINSDYNTVLFVTYGSSVVNYRLLEDDYITVYGVANGIYSYEAVSGETPKETKVKARLQTKKNRLQKKEETKKKQ